ncbi:MAG: serine/threonine-protein kinase [Dehalococcoidia bacterium]
MPQSIAHYELQEWLGAGATGSVYRARDTRTGASVALKVIRPEVARHDDVIARLETAARVGSQLYHPNIARVIEAGEAGGERYIASELVEGESLRSRLQREGRLSEAETYRIALSVAHALNAAEAQRVVHRNLTPENILLGEGAKVGVSDFGIAATQDVMASTRIAFVPAPDYAAPEVHERPVYVPSDMYSLGVNMFEMLTGGLPFDAAAPRRSLDVGLLRRASPRLAAVVLRLLQESPDQRYHDPDDLIEALHLVGQLDTASVPDRRLKRASRSSGAAILGVAAARLRPDRVLKPVVRASRRAARGLSDGVIGAAGAFAALAVATGGQGRRAVTAGARRVSSIRWSPPRSAKLALAGTAAVVAIAAAGFLTVNAMRDSDDGDATTAAAGDGSGDETPVGVTVDQVTRTPRAATATSTAAPPPTEAADEGVVAGAAVAPPPSPTTAAAARRQVSLPPQPSAPPPAQPTPVPAEPHGPAPLPSPAPPSATIAVPSATPRPSGGGGGGSTGGSGPPPTATRTSTPILPTPVPPLQTIAMTSPGGWTVYWDSGLDDDIGSARVVCLRREPDMVPANCPGSATSWDAGGNIWRATIPNAQWMWVPGITKDSWNDDDQFYFARCFDIAGAPATGVLELAADHGANVYVNDNWIQWVTGSNNVTSVNIGALLESGENCIKLWAANGNACGNCRYEDNPAGLLARVRITYQPQ